MISLFLVGLLALSTSALPLDVDEPEVIYVDLPEQSMLVNEAMHQNILHNLQCFENTCSGCLKIQVPFIPFLTGDVCANIELIPDTQELNVKISINGMDVISKVVSLQPSPKVCVRFLPFNMGEFCGLAHDIKVGPTDIGGCLSIDAKVMNNPVLNLKLGCFGFPLPQLPGK